MSRFEGPISALRQLPRRRAASGAVVLGYHDLVADDVDAAGMTVGRRLFARHLDVLADLGIEIVSLRRLVDALAAGDPVDRLGVITFDDALLGVLEHAVPELSARGLTATVFTVTGHLGVEPPWWPEVQRTLTESELVALTDAGLELASHTVSHASLPILSASQVEHELGDSRRDLELLTGGPIDLLAYPSGHHDAEVRRLAADAGYRAAFTFLNGRILGDEDPFVLPRLTMGTHMTPLRLRYHLLRSATSWPDHQLDAVGAVIP
ncbi:MAG: polysaccharide deacetylase family protein [Acidimicrobiales bacterium]